MMRMGILVVLVSFGLFPAVLFLAVSFAQELTITPISPTPQSVQPAGVWIPVVASTVPGATCGGTERFTGGTGNQRDYPFAKRVADSDGRLQWRTRIHGESNLTVEVTVTCSSGVKNATANWSFDVH